VNLEVATYHAFTANTRGGNRADVVFGLDLESERKMQEIASSTGAPATVFVGVSQKLFDDEAPLPLRLRFFTPEIEENVCGHGTIAALEALHARGGFNGFQFPSGEFSLETNLGVQRAQYENGVAWLEYGDVPAWGDKIDHIAEEINLEVGEGGIIEPLLADRVAPALGLEPDDLHEDLPVLCAGIGRPKLVCAVPSTMLLDAIEPNFESIKALCDYTATTGIVAFTFPGRGGCFTDSRHFSLQHGVVEDAATGNAHAALAAYLCANQFFDDGKRAFSGAQGYAMRQPSRLEVRFRAEGNQARGVWVGGVALEVKS
jgi:trans-2,3-dihydro-3-hydroxyanthranilate isomerase